MGSLVIHYRSFQIYRKEKILHVPSHTVLNSSTCTLTTILLNIHTFQKTRNRLPCCLRCSVGVQACKVLESLDIQLLSHDFLYSDTFLAGFLSRSSYTLTRTLPVRITNTFSNFSHTLSLWCVWLSALLSWLVCAPGRESSTRPSVRRFVCVSVWAICPNLPNSHLTHTLKKMICLGISLFPIIHLSLFPSIPLVSPFSVSSLSDRAPQRAVITQKRRRWKVGKVLVQLSPTLHACFCSLYNLVQVLSTPDWIEKYYNIPHCTLHFFTLNLR